MEDQPVYQLNLTEHERQVLQGLLGKYLEIDVLRKLYKDLDPDQLINLDPED